MIVADLLAIDEHSFTIAFEGESPLPGLYYSIEGIGLSFLAGRLVWTRSGRAGLFFKHPVHQSVLKGIRPSMTGKIRVGLRPIPTGPASDEKDRTMPTSGDSRRNPRPRF